MSGNGVELEYFSPSGESIPEDSPPAVKVDSFTSVNPAKNNNKSDGSAQDGAVQDEVMSFHDEGSIDAADDKKQTPLLDTNTTENNNNNDNKKKKKKKKDKKDMTPFELQQDRLYQFFLRVKAKGKELIVYIFFMLFFTLATYTLRGDERVFYMSDRMKANLLQRDFGLDMGGEKTFYDISDVRDIWLFVEGPMTEFLYGLQLDVNRTNYGRDSQYYVNQHNRILGGIRVRQQRVKPYSCAYVNSEYDDVLTQCYDEVSEEEDTETFTGRSGTEYTYMTAEETNEPPYWGQLDLYQGGGYVKDLPLDRKEAIEWFKNARNDKWINVQTRAVFIDMTSYNPSQNLHFVARMTFELPATGGVRPKTDVAVLKINRYMGGRGYFLFVLEVALGLFVIGFTLEEIKEMKELGRNYITQPWNIIDMINLFVFYIVYAVKIYMGLAIDGKDPVLHLDEYITLWPLVVLALAEAYLSATNAFLLWLKFFKFLNFNPRIRFLYRTFAKASRDLIYFTVLFFIFFLGFAHCGYLAFSDIEEFRSFPISFLSLFSAIVGDLSYESLALSNRVFGPFFFIIFNTIVLLILINMFLAIISDAYTAVREEDAKAEEEDMVLGYSAFWKGLRQDPFWGKLARKRKSEIVKAVDVADVNQDNKIDQTELINAIALKREDSESRTDSQRRKRAEDEGKWIMKQFDRDGNAHLDEEEQKELQAFLTDSMPIVREEEDNDSDNKQNKKTDGKVKRLGNNKNKPKRTLDDSFTELEEREARRKLGVESTGPPELEFSIAASHLQKVEKRLERLEAMVWKVLSHRGHADSFT